MKTPFALLCAASFVCLYAGGTRTWEHRSQADFEKGSLKKLSLRGDGRLALAPAFREVYDASTAYLWAVAEDGRGFVYFGGGGMDTSASRLFVMDASGATKVLAELPGLEIHSIAVDRQGRVYAATAPDGKVYRVSQNAAPEVFYDPKAKYIWAIAFNSTGELLVATGDTGELHKVSADGSGTVFFKTEESHARAMVIDPADNVYLGTEPGGLVLRVSPAGEGFVLHQASKREVTALALDSGGNLYAAAVGNKQPVAAPQPQLSQAQQPAQATTQVTAPPTSPDQPAQPQQQQPRPAPPPAQPAPQPAVVGGSEVFRIERDGYPRRMWGHATEIVYSIAFDPRGRALIGTGNQGNIYRIESPSVSTLLLNVPPTQVTALAAGSGGRLWAATGNIGKLFQLGPGLEPEGTYESDVLDAGFFTRWGRLWIDAGLSGGAVSVSTRSGNLDLPQRNWSPWQDVTVGEDGGRIGSPPARFLQYRVVLKASPEGHSPEISKIEIAYLPANVAPAVDIVEITPPNFRFPPMVISAAPIRSVNLPQLGRASRSGSGAPVTIQPAGAMTYWKGDIGARWLATDENGDALQSKLEIRGVRESNWILVKDKIDNRNLSWDSTVYPDGEYVLRVTVSDAPDNPPDQALQSSLVSEPFLIDNTPPAVTGVEAVRDGARAVIRWRAEDALNVLQKAEYSLDGGDWIPVRPTTTLSDSRRHDDVLNLDSLAPGEHVIAVRVTDSYDNQAVEKTILR